MKILRDPKDITDKDAFIFSFGMAIILTLAVIGVMSIIGYNLEAFAEEPNMTPELYGQMTNGTVQFEDTPIRIYTETEKGNMIRYNEATRSSQLHTELQQALRAECDDDGRCEYLWEYPNYVFRDGKVMKLVSEFGIYEIDEEKTKIMLDGIIEENKLNGLIVKDDNRIVMENYPDGCGRGTHYVNKTNSCELDDTWDSFAVLYDGDILGELSLYHLIGIIAIAFVIIAIITYYDQKERKLKVKNEDGE